MSNRSIFHPDFKARPFWWEAYEPEKAELTEVPKEARVAIIGGGYAGLAAALQLAKDGVEAVVLEAAQPGFGASTRNGGIVASRCAGAWCRGHYRALEAKVDALNRYAQAGAAMLERDRQREEIGSDYYHGG